MFDNIDTRIPAVMAGKARTRYGRGAQIGFRCWTYGVTIPTNLAIPEQMPML